MASMDFTNMNMNTEFFSWIISVLLKIYGYEYEYAGYYPRGALLTGNTNRLGSEH